MMFGIVSKCKYFICWTRRILIKPKTREYILICLYLMNIIKSLEFTKITKSSIVSLPVFD